MACYVREGHLAPLAAPNLRVYAVRPVVVGQRGLRRREQGYDRVQRQRVAAERGRPGSVRPVLGGRGRQQRYRAPITVRRSGPSVPCEPGPFVSEACGVGSKPFPAAFVGSEDELAEPAVGGSHSGRG